MGQAGLHGMRLLSSFQNQLGVGGVWSPNEQYWNPRVKLRSGSGIARKASYRLM